MSRMLRLWMSLLVWSWAGLVAAHDVSPAYFEIGAETPARYHAHPHDATQPTQPSVEIAATAGPFVAAGTHLRQGIPHIPFGNDHLLVVLVIALLLIARWTWLWAPDRYRRFLRRRTVFGDGVLDALAARDDVHQHAARPAESEQPRDRDNGRQHLPSRG